MNIDSDCGASDPTQIPEVVRQPLRRGAIQRNLGTAVALSIAISGGLISPAWLAATAGSTFLALGAWRHKQLKQAGSTELSRDDAGEL